MHLILRWIQIKSSKITPEYFVGSDINEKAQIRVFDIVYIVIVCKILSVILTKILQ